MLPIYYQNVNTTLFASGTSFGDEHINAIIRNALSINTFHLIVFCVNESEIEKIKIKYSDYKNVIVFESPTAFGDIAKLIDKLFD